MTIRYHFHPSRQGPLPGGRTMPRELGTVHHSPPRCENRHWIRIDEGIGRNLTVFKDSLDGEIWIWMLCDLRERCCVRVRISSAAASGDSYGKIKLVTVKERAQPTIHTGETSQNKRKWFTSQAVPNVQCTQKRYKSTKQTVSLIQDVSIFSVSRSNLFSPARHRVFVP